MEAMAYLRRKTVRWALSGLILSVLLAGTARKASGDETLSYAGPSKAAIVGALALSAGFLAADIAFTVHDISAARQGEHPSTFAGIGEILVTAPQLALLSIAVARDGASASSAGYLALSLWPAALLVHGIWNLATPDGGSHLQDEATTRRRIAIAPTVTGDGLGAGFVAVGRF